MKRVTLLACGLMLCVAVTAGLAQQPDGDAFVADDADSPTPADIVAQEVPQDAAALREVYLKRMQEKALLMGEAELKEALDEADQEIDELTAQRRLEEAQAILKEIAEKHPHTRAGGRARAMLEIDSNTTPFGTFPASTSDRNRSAPVATGGYQPI